MINKIFEAKIPFVYKYFSKALEAKQNKKREFPQSIILESTDCFSSYYFALELARNLNCTEDCEPNCNCINCKWIKSYAHPAINNVSQTHFKPDDDSTTTQISIKQIKEIEKTLTLSSDYHRFFIFFSSPKNGEIKSNQYGYNDIDFVIEPINSKIFNVASANAILKSVEEPPKNTTFVFLTKSRADILSTIVSRSQVFKLSANPDTLDYSDIMPYFSNYFELNYLSAIELSESILNYLNNNNYDLELILNKTIAYLKDILKENIDNKHVFEKINRDISFISEAIKHTHANMQDKVILEALFLKIARGH